MPNVLLKCEYIIQKPLDNRCGSVNMILCAQWNLCYFTDTLGLAFFVINQRFPILLLLKLSEGVGCTLSSDKYGYSLQRLLAKVE